MDLYNIISFIAGGAIGFSIAQLLLDYFKGREFNYAFFAVGIVGALVAFTMYFMD